MKITPALIVDDSFMIVKIIKKALLLNTLDNYHFSEENIYTAADGMEAFERMGEHKDIELIISDINMPHLTGHEFIEILKDTGKLKNVTVIFVTSSSKKLMLPSSINEDILGVIYKPFKYDSFNQRIQALKDDKQKQTIELNRIKLKQFEQKKEIKNVCEKYLKEFEILNDAKILKNLINENFGDYDVGKEDYPDLAFAILSTYMFDVKSDHKVNNKKIFCILKSFEIKQTLTKNRFSLISGFEAQVEHVNENNMKRRKVLDELTEPLVEKISLALAKAGKFPKLPIKLYFPYVDYIMQELTKIDCYFDDIELEKTILEQKEIVEFNKWLLNIIQKKVLRKTVDAVSESEELDHQIDRRLRLVYKRSVLLAQHFTGQIEYTIWKKARKSLEITQYLKKHMPNTMPSSSRFLLYMDKISIREHDEYLPYEKQNVLVLSTDMKILEIFKRIEQEPFDKWNFFCYTKESLMHSWMKNGKPSKIIIDYDFKTQVVNNGIQFLKQIVKKYPEVKRLVMFHQIYMIVDNANMIEVHKHATEYNVNIIRNPLEQKEINEALIYH